MNINFLTNSGINRFLKKYLSIKGIIFLGVLFSFIFSTVAYYHYHLIHRVKVEEQRLDLERKASAEKMREGGRRLAAEMQLHPLKLQEDPFAEPDPSDTQELAQAKLWHQTPPAQRAKIFADKPVE